MSSTPNGPLSGLLVVSLEQAVAAPLCTSRLADAGARVIKVERPEGDFARGYDHVAHGESAYFVWLNRGKESLVADLKNPDDLALVERLLADADVFVQNLAPGATERLGLGAETLRAKFPRLITVSISGYGESGPYREMKAYDLLIQCEAGLASITGTPDGPGRVGVSAADIACGMNSHAAILEALIRRGITGEGCSIAVSLFDSLAAFGRLNDVAEFSRHPQLRRVDIGTPTGPVAIPAPPAIIDGNAAPQLRAIPAIGAQSDAIRAEYALADISL